MTPEERKKWLEERRTGIGGSDVAAILGEDPNRTALDIYNSKVGEVAEIDSAPIRRGNRQEPVARAFYEEVTGRKVIPAPSMLRDPRTECLFVNLDGVVERQEAEAPAQRGSLELKAPGLRNFSKMRMVGMSRAYYLQVQHGLGITGYPFGAFAAFSAELDQMLQFDVPRDDELIAHLRIVAVDFWTRHVVPRKPPEDEKIALPAEFNVPTGEIAKLETPEWNSAVQGYLEAKELTDLAAELMQTAKSRCLDVMGHFNVVEGGGVRVHNTMQAGRKTFDHKALAKAHPQLDLAPFFKTGAPFPTFRLFPLRKQLTSGE